MQPEFALAVHADQHGDGDQAAGVPREAGTGPDITPGMAGDHVLELFVERRDVLQAALDMGIAQYCTADLHAGLVTLFLVHFQLRVRDGARGAPYGRIAAQRRVRRAHQSNHD